MWGPELLVTMTSDGVDFSPRTLPEEIAQNVRTILATARGSVPLDRSFGMDPTLVDLPLPVARTRIVKEVLETVERYEPRVKVLQVLFDGDGAEGVLKPMVRVMIREAP